MDVSRLTKLFESGNSGVKKFTKTLSVVVDRSHKGNWELGAVLFLNSKLQHYFEGFDGVLLGYEDVSVKSSPSEPDADIDLHHVTIQAKFFVFSPEVGKCLSGKVVAKKKSSITVAVHDYFQITCLSPKNLKKLDVGSQVKVKVSSVVYVSGRPNMMGEVDKITETSNTLTSPSTSAAVNGVSSPVKRKAEAEEKPKKKAKTAAAAAESHDDGGSTTTESDHEEQSPPKTPNPKAPKTPGKTPKPVPDGFNVVEITRPNGRKDKEFVGPDGKRYRSIPEIYRKLNLDPESGSANSSSSQKSVEEMKEQVEYVANSWNKGEDGELAKNKNKFYNSEGLKEICKTNRHPREAKSKKGKAGKKLEDKEDEKDDDKGDDKGDAEEAEEEAEQATEPLEASPNKASVTIGDTGDAKKKKKKKKNKANDKTI